MVMSNILINAKKTSTFVEVFELFYFNQELYLVKIADQDFSIELWAHYLLSVASHHTTAWSEVHWIIDQWSLD